MPAMNPSKDAMSVVMVQFSPEAATTKETVDRNIKKIESTKREIIFYSWIGCSNEYKNMEKL